MAKLSLVLSGMNSWRIRYCGVSGCPNWSRWRVIAPRHYF